MDQQKVVVVLLLITIILSVVTVVITLGADVSGFLKGNSDNSANSQNIPSERSGNVALEVRAPNSG